MLNLWKNVFNGKFVKDIIDNFDPYRTKELINIELNKQHNEKSKLNSKEK